MRLPTDRLLRVIVAVLLIWPPIHAVLIPKLGVSTWRFGGWGMYATPAPRRSHVVVIGRDCVFNPPLIGRPEGLRGISIGDTSLRDGALPMDASLRETTLDAAALRRESDILALDGEVRRLHQIRKEVPLAFAILEPRIRRGVVYASAKVFVVADDGMSLYRLRVSTLAGFERLLPECGARS